MLTANVTNIQILRSYANTAPTSLLDGQLAYSYVSNTLFIGSNTYGVVAITDQTTANIARQASANTIYTQGVDAGQNAAISIIQGVDATQNSWISSNVSYIAGVDATQNTNITAVNQFSQSVYTYAQSVYNNYAYPAYNNSRSEEHTSELQSH